MLANNKHANLYPKTVKDKTSKNNMATGFFKRSIRRERY